MPFTAPSTYASQSQTGYLAQLMIAPLTYTAGVPTPGTYVPFAEIKTISPDLVNVQEIDVTHLLSPSNTMEKTSGMIKPGKLAFTGNLIGDASQLSITSNAQANTNVGWKIVAPILKSTKTYTLVGIGYFSSYKPGPWENNKPNEFSAELEIAGAYTETVA